jgi:hypothetical protein
MSSGMTVVVDYEILKGLNEELVVKELSLEADDLMEKYHFESP